MNQELPEPTEAQLHRGGAHPPAGATPRAEQAAEGLHGGNLGWAVRSFGGPIAQWLDLSTGISPFAYPHTGTSDSAWQRLPDAGEYAELEAAARACYGAPAGADVVAAAGSQALLQLLPTCVEPADVAIVGFTYREHELAWRAAGHRVHIECSLASAARCTHTIVTRPNNPDGTVHALEEMLMAREAAAAHGGMLLVDEAFADVCAEVSLAAYCDQQALLVLRSFGKFFGLAGLRLGFALGAPALVQTLRAKLGPWPVSGPALEIGARALHDSAWQKRQIARLRARARALRMTLLEAGLRLEGGTSLFVLARHPRAQNIWRALLEARILTRRFAGRPEWLRFGLPSDDEQLERLRAALIDSMR